MKILCHKCIELWCIVCHQEGSCITTLDVIDLIDALLFPSLVLDWPFQALNYYNVCCPKSTMNFRPAWEEQHEQNTAHARNHSGDDYGRSRDVPDQPVPSPWAFNQHHAVPGIFWSLRYTSRRANKSLQIFDSFEKPCQTDNTVP